MIIETTAEADIGGSPLVTIAIPTYNGANNLSQAVASVLTQLYPNAEILISNNASSDNTATVCLELMKRDARIKCFHHVKNIGMLANIGFLLKRARGKYFMWLADDDCLAPGALSMYVDFLEANPAYSLVSGKIEHLLNGRVLTVEEDFNLEQSSAALRVISYYSRVTSGGMFHGLMRLELAQAMSLTQVMGSDWHFVASLALIGKIKYLDFIGYRKKFGNSRSPNDMGLTSESVSTGRHPHLKISIDAFRFIATGREVYALLPFYKRYPLAAGAFLAGWLHYNAIIYPFVVGGKIKRWLKRVLSIKKFQSDKDRVLARRLP